MFDALDDDDALDDEDALEDNSPAAGDTKDSKSETDDYNSEPEQTEPQRSNDLT